MGQMAKINHPTKRIDPGGMIERCQRCKNLFALVWIKEGEDYNDFGDRFCPFCGLNTDEATGSVLSLYPN